MIINLISCPRTVSTALMYSFAQRSDMACFDEPYYAHYLTHQSKRRHPGHEEILAALPNHAKEVRFKLQAADGYRNVFVKNMAHHISDLSFDHFEQMIQVFLIRNPKQLIFSFQKVIENPTMQDIGLSTQLAFAKYLKTNNRPYLIIDSNHLINQPDQHLQHLCDYLNLPYDSTMLSWPSGPKSCDGVWAKYWYGNVHLSTGFTPSYREKPIDFPQELEDLLSKAQDCYQQLINL